MGILGVRRRRVKSDRLREGMCMIIALYEDLIQFGVQDGHTLNKER